MTLFQLQKGGLHLLLPVETEVQDPAWYLMTHDMK